MTSAGPSLDALLQAVTDPTRRRILQALKPKGGKAAKEKDTGLCASDIEARMLLSHP